MDSESVQKIIKRLEELGVSQKVISDLWEWFQDEMAKGNVIPDE